MDTAQKTINNIRILSADCVEKANSGHPGAPMGIAPMAYALWMNKMKHNPADPTWQNRDRFVLSNGHASALLYSLLHLFGYGLTMDDLKQFRQLDSKTPGHPELSPGIEVTTGPLGQGIANSVGFAIAETMLAEKFNKDNFDIVNHRTYAICGDGCMMEGISSEACSLAGTLKLGKLTLLYDDNEISIEGDTDIAFRENVPERFKAYGWQVIQVKDGNDYKQILAALEESEKDDRPSLIVCPTTIAYGCAAKEGTAASHGAPLGEAELTQARKALGMPSEPFTVLDEVYEHVKQIAKNNAADENNWKELLAEYSKKFPELYSEYQQWFTKELSEEIINNKDIYDFEGSKATRATSGEVINRLAKLLPNLVGGSADLAPSNKTNISGGGDYSAENRSGRNMHFGVREHSMAAICNAMALHGGLRVFCGTFFVFSDYMKHSMRMSALMQAPVVYVLTHDSIGVGEDGATHQPIEHLAGLRAMPGLDVYRPCDGHETAIAWIDALKTGIPTCMILTRQNLPTYENSLNGAEKGAYVLSKSKKETPDMILMASGSEVEPIMNAQKELLEKGIDVSVVSVPCTKRFLEQSNEYRESVMPSNVRARIAIEAAATMPWYQFVGLDGKVIGLDHYGASAPADQLFEKFGINANNVVKTALQMMDK